MGAEESRFTISELQQFYQRVEIGDILKFPSRRGPYSHFGIYIGEYKGRRHCVIHFTAPDEDVENIVLGDVSRVAKGASALGQASAGKKASKQEISRCSVSAKDMSKGLKDAGIQITEVRDLLIQYPCVFINNSNDESWVPREKSVIRDQAIWHYENRDNEKEYNVYFNNCEHFVNDIRYGKSRSKQAENVLAGGVVVAAVAAIAGFGYALSQCEDEDKPRRRRREEEENEDEERPRHQRRR